MFLIRLALYARVVVDPELVDRRIAGPPVPYRGTMAPRDLCTHCFVVGILGFSCDAFRYLVSLSFRRRAFVDRNESYRISVVRVEVVG